jgi:CheY-like chemotaxis protein/HPt (histidine-containing phosphotransfer) domain-containing protein
MTRHSSSPPVRALGADEAHALLHALPDGLLVEDSRRTVVFASSAFGALFGANAARLIGADCRVLALRFRPLLADPDAFDLRVDELLAGSKPATDAISLADGRTLERTYRPISVGGAVRGHLWSYRDVPRTTLLHESTLREVSTSLASATMAVQLSLELPLEPEGRVLLQSAERSLQRIAAALPTANSQHGRSQSEPPASTAPGSAPRVLVAEDSEVTGRLVQHALEHAGMRVRVVMSGDEAIAIARAERFDVALVDLHLPGRSGPDVARALRQELGPKCPPMVAMTASMAGGDLADFDAVLAKPFQLGELRSTVAAWARRARARSDKGLAILDLPYFRSLGGDDQNGLDTGLLAELADVFARDAEARIRALGGAHERGQANDKRRHAHGLRGACLAIGAKRLAWMAGQVEDGSETEADPARLLTELSLVRAALRAGLASVTGGERPLSPPPSQPSPSSSSRAPKTRLS